MVTSRLPAWSPMARCEATERFFSAGVGPDAGEGAERRMHRAGQAVGAERRRAVDRPFHVGDALLAGGGVGRDQVHAGIAHGGDGGALKPDPVQHLAKALVVVGRALEDRDLDAVVAGRLDVLEQVPVLARDVGRPQEHAETDFHDVSPLWLSMNLAANALAVTGLAANLAGNIWSDQTRVRDYFAVRSAHRRSVIEMQISWSGSARPA